MIEPHSAHQTKIMSGWMVYMIAVLLTDYDGILTLIFQPLCAAFCSAMAVIASVFLRIFFLVKPLARSWNSSWESAATLFVISLMLFCFGNYWGLQDQYIEPETGEELTRLHPVAAIGSYVAMVFAVVNWPDALSNKPDQKDSATMSR